MGVFITSPTGLCYHIREDVIPELQGEDLIFLGKAGDGNKPIGYIKLEPGMVVTFGPEPPEIHDGREGWPTERAWPKA